MTTINWAEWTSGGVIHLVATTDLESRFHGYGACAEVHSTADAVHGPRLNLSTARPLVQHDVATSCALCTEIALVQHGQAVEARVRAERAYEIRSELVCCDAYDVCRPSALDPDARPEENPAYHAICYWGEAAARLVEGSDDCEHVGGSWFDRELCPEPCGVMHDRCVDCGEALESCLVRAQSYFRRQVRAADDDGVKRIEPAYRIHGTSTYGGLITQLRRENASLRADNEYLAEQVDNVKDAMRHGMGLD